MATDPELRAHQDWIGFIQPVGLVVSPPALVAAQAHVNRNSLREQEQLRALVGEAKLITDLPRLMRELLAWQETDLVSPPEALDVVLPEYHDTLRPTLAVPDPDEKGKWLMLVQVLPAGTDLDSQPGDDAPGWRASPQIRLERLMRDRHVAIGLLCNGSSFRLVYYPRGESAGHLTFPVGPMCEPSGRLMLGALLMLLHADRVFTMGKEQRLAAILANSRKYQNEVSTALAEQVLTALQDLLRGFQAADEASRGKLLADVRRGHRDDLYGGLLTTIMRLVFVLYAEDRGLMPAHDAYVRHYSLTGLFDRLRADEARYPDTMDQRFGAWSQLLTLFRLIFRGGGHGGFHLPKRHGDLFDPDTYPFLEGRPEGTHFSADKNVKLEPPRISDGVVLRLLKNLLVLNGERLSYRALDVEQIGSVYESMMGFELEEARGRSIAVRPHHVVVDLDVLLKLSGKARTDILKEQADCELAAVAAKAFQAAKSVDELVAALDKRVSPQTRSVLPPGALYLQPGQERRRSGSHYTPRTLTEPIVRKTLQPLLTGLGANPTPEQILNLKVCDPAMGSGAFLVEACRFLGDALKESWNRHQRTPKVPPDEDVILHARRLVAQRCLYGVDKNKFAVNLAKLSLWLFTLAKDHPFTFLDHALRWGDSLVGVSRRQVADFSLSAEKTTLGAALSSHVAKQVRLAEDARLRIHAIGDPPDTDALAQHWRDANEALHTIRLLGDLLVAAFFSEDNNKARAKKLDAMAVKVKDALNRDDGGATLLNLLDDVREQTGPEARIPERPFHWELELPEVFGEGRDGFDAFVGNPPYSGKNGISAAGGESYIPWLQATHPGSHGNADLSAHFFRRTFILLGENGALGLVATKTIAQGDGRSSGLKPIVAEGGVIYDATTMQLWEGAAAVAFIVVHIVKGRDRATVQGHCKLNGKAVPCINSRLRPKPERPDPVALRANAELSFQGSVILGMGFTLTPEERAALVAKDKRNADRTLPYLGGEEVNSNPDQGFNRYVICFSELPTKPGAKYVAMSEDQAKGWPDLYDIVKAKVWPERQGNKRAVRAQYWWLFGEQAPALYESLAGRQRCLVNSQVSKHLVFAWEMPHHVFGHTLYVYVAESDSFFAVVQSRIHEAWARLLSSSLEERLRYTPSDCFENFPFPQKNPREPLPALEAIGQKLYEARAKYMLEANQGLTATYNQLKAPDCDDQPVVALRELHLELDRAVCAAFGWPNFAIPPYTTPQTEEEKKALEAFEDEVIDRLFDLNAKRAQEERLMGAGAEEAGKAPAKKRGRKSKDDKTGTLI